MVRETLYRKEVGIAKPPGDREAPGELPQRPTGSLVKYASTSGLTSNWEEHRFCRSGSRNRCVHRRGVWFVGEPAARDQSTDATGSTPLPFPNCVHYVSEPVGESLKYLVWGQSRPIACLAWSSAPRHLGARDRYIGWSADARRRNIRFLAYNPRFLVVPWVRVKRLASHILGRMAARISQDWESFYSHPLYFLETFVDPERFRGTCYYAANWVWLGETTGRGKASNSYVPNRSIKHVLGYPLSPRFRELLVELR